MTHTLYREGTVESLKNDYVFVITGATNFNKKGCAPRLRKMLEILSTFQPINLGSMNVGTIGRGTPVKVIIQGTPDTSISQAVFDDKETAIKALRALNEANLGISVTISGLNEEVKDIIKKASVGEFPHTVNLALGFMGKREKAPSDDARLITTMCGHAMISEGIVNHLLDKIKNDIITPIDAAVVLARQCTCGAFNTVRAAQLLEQLTSPK
ncbi:MAG: hypothetical protein V3V81_04130 [Candidatus Bathyarchaeia archaeon]